MEWSKNFSQHNLYYVFSFFGNHVRFGSVPLHFPKQTKLYICIRISKLFCQFTIVNVCFKSQFLGHMLVSLWQNHSWNKNSNPTKCEAYRNLDLKFLDVCFRKCNRTIPFLKDFWHTKNNRIWNVSSEIYGSIHVDPLILWSFFGGGC